MCGVFDEKPATVKTITAVTPNQIREITKTGNNVEIVKKLQEHGLVKVVPPPEEFRGPALNEMKKFDLVLQVAVEGKTKACTISVNGNYVTTDIDREKRTFARDGNPDLLELYKNTEGFSKKERNASIFDAITQNPSSIVDQIGITQIKEFNAKNFKDKKDRENADKLAETDQKSYLNFIKDRGLYDRFLDFIVKELQHMAGNENAASPSELQENNVQNIMLDRKRGEDEDDLRARTDRLLKKYGGKED